MLSVAVGCTNVTGSEANAASVVELADNTVIPDDGVITAAQFRSIAGKDRTVTFTGTSSEGIVYVWSFNGKDIKNAANQNLKVEFITQGDELNSVKAGAGNAPYGIGLKLSGDNGLITVPTLTLTLTEKWDADSGALCKQQDTALGKISAAALDNSGETTKVSFNIIETGSTYYVVGGKTIATEQTAGTGTTTGTTGSGSTNSTPATSGDAAGSTSDSSGNSATTATTNTCTLSISCSTILNNMANLTQGKASFVPSDGWILYPTETSFTTGESVHDVLQRVCRQYGIHMESKFTPAYNSAYVQGINQLYEFDCGELSGWMYNVNGWFPNYGCSQYTVKNGDVINWIYTCDLGKDVGDNSMW
ncbi:DUF4430 domain-containing protein [Acetobacterium paludosum]|uniref:DUF4430 domain-containing protein n=2 Tax=Acetobacterium paludosum TaxID=52693 RepID=A0A923HUF6_9FIRM|nr:DUF4430 domain-containing protein [Acetobacterium paludosum]